MAIRKAMRSTRRRRMETHLRHWQEPCRRPQKRRRVASSDLARPAILLPGVGLAGPHLHGYDERMAWVDEILRANPDYVESLYAEYRRDPASVDERWALIFAGYEWARDGAGPATAGLVHAYRELGHLVADLDPLGGSPRTHPLLRLEELGFSEQDLDRVVEWTPVRGGGRGPLRELLRALAETYADTLGVEFLGISDKNRRTWLQERMEPRRNRPELSAADRRALLERLLDAEVFEQFLHVRYAGQKRFSLEGGEALIPLLDTLVDEAARLGVEEMVLGMAHRGRLN